MYVDGIYLRQNWGGEYENVAILVAIAVNEDGYREVLGAAEGMKEDKASWVSFFQRLRGRGLDGVKLVVGDKCFGMLEAVGEVFPEAKNLRSMKLKQAARKVEDGIEETLTYCDFPSERWTRICTNNVIEWLDREICRSRVCILFCEKNLDTTLSIYCMLFLMKKKLNITRLRVILSKLCVKMRQLDMSSVPVCLCVLHKPIEKFSWV